MPARHTYGKTTRLKEGAQARQTRRGSEPRPQSKHLAKIVTKTPHTKNKNRYLLFTSSIYVGTSMSEDDGTETSRNRMSRQKLSSEEGRI